MSEQMKECGACLRPTPHRYAGDMWCCLRCEATAQAAEIKRLKAELARLTPKSPTSLESSGQMAEDRELVRRVMGIHVAREMRNEGAALSRLAAKAQGYEAVKAANDAMREPMRKLRAAVGMPAEGESTVVDAVLKERQEQEETIKALVEVVVYAERSLELGTIAARDAVTVKIAKLRTAGVLP